MDFGYLHNIDAIETLLLQCKENRHFKIANYLENGQSVYIKAVMITNDFQKPIIEPLFLYITMLPIDIIVDDSILLLSKHNNILQLEIYSDNNDIISGVQYNLELLTKMNIKLSKLKYVESSKYIDNNLSRKINNLRQIKDNWELLQIIDSLFATRKLFNSLNKNIKTKHINNESILESNYYKKIIQLGFTIPYLPIIASGQNASYIHYFNNNSNISNNKNILIDAGVRNRYGYCSDITRTYIDETSDIQKRLYKIVSNTHDRCIRYIHNNINEKQITLDNLNNICIDSLIEEFAKFESDSDYIEWSEGIKHCRLKSHQAYLFINYFYTHFIGHNIGLDTHDPNHDNVIREGCVFTIEPGIYFNNKIIPFLIPDIFYKVGGIRIEDMYTIIKNNSKLKLIYLSSNINKK